MFAPGPPHSIIPSSFLSFPIGSSFPFFTRSNSPLSLRFFPRRRRRICVVAAPSQTQRLQLFGREDFLCVSDVGEGGEQEQQKRLAPRGLGKANIWKGSSPLSSFLSRRESGERKKGFQMEGGGEGGVNRHRRRRRRPPISQALNPFFFFFSFLPPRKIWKNGKGNLLLAVTLPSHFYSTILPPSFRPFHEGKKKDEELRRKECGTVSFFSVVHFLGPAPLKPTLEPSSSTIPSCHPSHPYPCLLGRSSPGRSMFARAVKEKSKATIWNQTLPPHSTPPPGGRDSLQRGTKHGKKREEEPSESQRLFLLVPLRQHKKEKEEARQASTTRSYGVAKGGKRGMGGTSKGGGGGEGSLKMEHLE